MKGKKLQDHREYVVGALAELISDTKHIKQQADKTEEHLRELNGRVRTTETSISWIKGVGSTIGFLFSGLFAYLIKKVF